MQLETFKSRPPIDWPDDVGLYIPSSIDINEVPDNLVELYVRFYQIGFIDELGTSCVMQSSLLRRIMRLHGMDASLKQVVLYWRNDKKGYNLLLGNPLEPTQVNGNQIDLHMVVKSGGWLLDFACSPLHYRFGYTSPRGIIIPWTKELEKNYVDIGIGGKVSYVENKITHPKLKNWQVTQRPDILEFSKKYFERYAI
jgi:hypothetical protein